MQAEEIIMIRVTALGKPDFTEAVERLCARSEAVCFSAASEQSEVPEKTTLVVSGLPARENVAVVDANVSEGRCFLMSGPPAVSMRDFSKLRKLCRNNGMQVAVLRPFYFCPICARLKEFVSSGAAGTLRELRLTPAVGLDRFSIRDAVDCFADLIPVTLCKEAGPDTLIEIIGELSSCRCIVKPDWSGHAEVQLAPPGKCRTLQADEADPFALQFFETVGALIVGEAIAGGNLKKMEKDLRGFLSKKY